MLQLFVPILRLATRAQCRVEVEGLSHFTGSPATLVVANHRRDTDVPIIASLLADHLRSGGRLLLPHFVAREDLFRHGFLGNYLADWPPALRTILACIPLQKIMPLLQVHPMRRIPERTLREVLEDILVSEGNLQLASVLRPAWLEKFFSQAPDTAAPLTVKDALDRRYRNLLETRYGLSKLTLARFRQIRQAEQEVIAAHLERFTRLLEQGEIIQIEPEGTLSQDGHLGRMRNGLYYLLNTPKTDIRVLPVAVTYDWMTRGRPWALVRFGAECSLQGLSRRETNRRMTALLGQAMTVTSSQLGAGYLRRLRSGQGARIHAMALAAYMQQEAQQFSAAGAAVQRCLFEDSQCWRRAQDFLDYCSHIGILVPAGPEQYRFAPAHLASPAPADHGCTVIDYMANEMTVIARAWDLPAG